MTPQEIARFLSPSSKLAQLQATGEIGTAEIAAALRWTEDYHSHEYGYRERRGAGGCIHEGMSARAMAGGRLEQVAEAIGSFGEQRLIALLGQANSYEAAAKRIFGEGSKVKARDSLRAQLVLLLHQLAHQYRKIDIERRKRRPVGTRPPKSVDMPA